jgi:hypothetical protein
MTMIKNIALALVSVAAVSGLALAGDPKAGAPAPKADAPKATPTAPAKMEAPKPPQELADMAKGMAGTWKCTGKALGEDMKTMGDLTGTAKIALEMNGWWVHLTYDAKMGKMPFHFEEYTTFEAASKKWHRVMMEVMGGVNEGWSTGATGGKIDWELTTHGMMGDGMFRDHEDISDAKAPKMWGEMSMDKGKTWTKVYEQTCKK